jgi:hypothetical protein
LAGDSSHSSYIQSQHTGFGNTTLSFGTSSGNDLSTERMFIAENGTVYINNNNVDNNSIKLLVSGSDSNGVCFIFITLITHKELELSTMV